MAQNKWLVSTNENRCKHAESLFAIKNISWVTGQQYHFNIGDVVYLFMSNESYVCGNGRKLQTRRLTVLGRESYQ